MIRILKIYSTTLALVIFSYISAQQEQENHVVNHFGSRQGLSHSNVNSIVSDQQNIKWIGTENGITKYNGYEFDYIRLNNKYAELKNENIAVLYTDYLNNLWIGTKGGGISMLNIEKNSIKNYSYLIDPNNKSDQRILSIEQDAQGHIWIGTWGNGIFVINPKTEMLLYHFNTTCLVYTILKDAYGNMWWGNYNILTTYDPIEDKLIEFPLDTEITDLINDPFRDKIWIGTAINASTNIYNYDHATQKINRLKTNVETSFARYLALDREHKLWIGTWSNGLYVSDPHLKKFTKVNIQKNNSRKDNVNFETVLDIHIDKNNIIWLSMAHGGGIIQIIPNKKFNNAYNLITNNLLQKDCNIQSIYKDRNKLWVGTFENGLFMGSDFSSLKNRESLQHKSTIYQYKNNLFVGFLEGYRIYNTENQSEIFRYPTIERVTSFLVDRKNRLWIGTEHDGMAMVPLRHFSESDHYTYFHDGGNGNFRLNNTDRITDIKEDRKGNIWVGTHNGFHLFDEKSQSFKHQTQLLSNDLPSTFINHIFMIGHITWIGTANGLLKLKFTNNELELLHNYTIEDGLNNDFISSITGDDEHLWISTTTEIVKFDVKNEAFTNYGKIDGIETSSFNQKSVYNDGEYIYFGGIDNITYFNPKKVITNTITPEVIIFKISVDNQHISPGQLFNGRVLLDKNINSTNEIVLTHNEKTILINFGLNDYLGELNTSYKYKLEGFQDTWINLNDRSQLSFTGLPSGSYDLQIIGTRNNQVWSTPKTLRLVIKPSPFLSIWAYSLYFIIFLMLLWVLYFIKMRQDKLKSTLEIARIDKEKEAELTEAKLNFFTNISHEFRTPLTLIVSPLIEILEDHTVSLPIAEKLTIVQKNANRLLNLVNQLLDFRKADHNLLTLTVETENYVSFAKEVATYFNELASSRNIHFTFTTNCDEILFPFDRNNMEIVLCNVLFNAFKNTEDGDYITIEIIKKGNHCITKIRDTGKGIEKIDQKRIFDRFYQIKTSESAKIIGSGIGLAFSKKIVELHQGSITVDSQIDIGSEFVITLTLTPNYPIHKRKKTDFIIKNESKNEMNEVSVLAEIGNKNKNPRKKTILVIDDNRDIRDYLRDLLSNSYEIEEAENGEVGYRKALQHYPDLIICDIMMPVKDGLSVCSDLKKKIETSHIPILLLTARSSALFEIEGLETGADDYITKPFNPIVIKTKIASILSNREKLKAFLQNKVKFEPAYDHIVQFDEEEAFIQEAIELVKINFQNNEFGIRDMVNTFHMSQSSLYRKIKSLTGLSLTGFIRSVRLKHAGQMILSSNAKLSHIAYEVGFNDYNYFKKSFKKHFECLPSAYRSKHKLKNE
ncbi:response regulator [Aquimarina sp. U1-2]|uniref:hybrid sensor histidine kinase/response regulator transcription factor n=1 Tax=Aquimarina sp. U1-2 TaxID=2823141 RepID=UPI001AECAFF9|nr:hybrid sensor histidine kinase/response regulator transcription factor [Aquimarina sp. U1-2]MBP2833010.1 response regulator [Aquimarina sp. U1-2]